MHLAYAVDRHQIAAALAGQLGIGEVLPRGRRREPFVGAVAEADRAGEGAHPDDLVAHRVRIDVGEVRHLLHVELGLDQAGDLGLPLLAGVGVEHVVERRVPGRRLQLGIIGKGRVGLDLAFELLLEGRDDLGLHHLAPFAAPGGGLERRGLGAQDRGSADRCRRGTR